MTTSTIIDLFRDRVKSQTLLINKSLPLDTVLKRIEKLGTECNISQVLVEAALVAFGIQQRYAARIDLNTLQQASSPEATRIAVLYASQKSVWGIMRVTESMQDSLKTIDTLMAFGRGAPDDQQLRWAETNGFGPAIASSADNLADLNDKRYKFLRDATMKTRAGVNVNARDSHVFVFLSTIAMQDDPNAVFDFYGVDENQPRLHKLNPAMAKELLLEFQQAFATHFKEYEEQLEAIKLGTYSKTFKFTE